MVFMKPEHKVAIRFEYVSFSYEKTPVLKDVSFHIHEKEFVTLVGPNGSGKTTLLKLILGFLKPQSGRITVFESEPSKVNAGYVPQLMDTNIDIPITVIDVVKSGLINGFSRLNIKNSVKDIQRVMELLDIADLKNSKYSDLSGGQKRRVLVARALVSNPSLLVLDEPTANMDIESERKLFSVLENLKKNTTIMIVTHDTEFVSELTDVLLCIGRSKEKDHNVVRHALERERSMEHELYGVKVMRVLHNTSLPDDCNCLKG